MQYLVPILLMGLTIGGLEFLFLDGDWTSFAKAYASSTGVWLTLVIMKGVRG